MCVFFFVVLTFFNKKNESKIIKGNKCNNDVLAQKKMVVKL